MPTAFISYAKEDLEQAQDVYKYLENNGHSAWLDEIKLLPGQVWEDEIRKAIKSSDVFIACLSTRSVNKRGVFQKELKHAFEVLSEIPEGHVFLIPIRLDKCVVPDRFSPIQYLDWFCQDAHPKLLQSISLASKGKISEKEKFVILQSLMKLRSKTYFVYPDLRQAVQENKKHINGSRISETTLREVKPVLRMLQQNYLLEFSIASETGEKLKLHPLTFERVDRVYIKHIDNKRLLPLIKIVESFETNKGEPSLPG